MKLLLILTALVATFSCATTDQKTTEKQKSYNASLDTYKYPYTVEYFEFETQNKVLDMAYMDVEEVSKKVVVLLHGKNFADTTGKRLQIILWQRVVSLFLIKLDLEKARSRFLTSTVFSAGFKH